MSRLTLGLVLVLVAGCGKGDPPVGSIHSAHVVPCNNDGQCPYAFYCVVALHECKPFPCFLCPDPELCCSGGCTDGLTDSLNCGGCGIACAAGETCCDGRCTDLQSDSKHCGACGVQCQNENNTGCCNGQCNVNLDTNADHCGACGVKCFEQQCSTGRCAPFVESRAASPQNVPQTPGDKASSWWPMGPLSTGRLSGVHAEPAGGAGMKPLVTVVSPGGGYWKNARVAPNYTDPNWMEPTNIGLGDYNFTRIEEDIAVPGRLYGLTFNGLYVTTDEGRNWTDVAQLSGRPRPLAATEARTIDPRGFAQLSCPGKPTRVFAAPNCSGLLRSLDGGVTFQSEDPAGYPCVGGIVVDDLAMPARVYFTVAYRTFGSSAVFASPSNCDWCNNDCNMWQEANGSQGMNKLPFAIANTITTLGVAGDLMVYVSSASGGGNPGLWRTTDGGQNWGWITDTLNFSGPILRTMKYAGLFNGQARLLADGVQPITSANAGANWDRYCQLVNPPSAIHPCLLHDDTRDMFFRTSLPHDLFTVTDGSQFGAWPAIFHTDIPGNLAQDGPDGANATTIPDIRLNTTQAYTIAYAPNGVSDPRLLLGTQDNIAAWTQDYGKTWIPMYVGSWGDVFSILVHPVRTNRAYALNYGGVLRTDNTLQLSPNNFWHCNNGCTSQWDIVPARNNYAHANLMALDPRDSVTGAFDAVAVAQTFNIAVTNDGGDTWPWITNLNPAPGHIYSSVAFDDDGNLYVGTADDGIYYCTDRNDATMMHYGGYCEFGGWQSLGKPANHIYGIRVTHPAGNQNPTYWAATADGLYRWRPNADPACGNPQCWARVVGGQGYHVNDVEPMSGEPQCVYAAMGWGGSARQHRGGILFSRDNGQTWSSLTSGLPIHQTPVADVTPRPGVRHQLAAATYGRGAWTFQWAHLPVECGGP